MTPQRTIRDATFPGLELALDPAAMQELLRWHLPECREEGLTVEDVRILQVQYQPRKRGSVLYSVKFRPAGGRSRHQWLAVELLRDGQGAPPVDGLLVDAYRQSGERPLRNPVVRIPEAHLVAHAFPFDPALPGLVQANDMEHMKAKFGRMWKQRRVRLRQVTVRPLGYTPGARAALLYETLSECRTTGLPEVRRLVGKLDGHRDAPELFARNWAVWKQAQLRFRMPPPVGHVSSPDLFLQEHIEGERLSELAGTGEFIGPVRQTARAIAVLHTLPLALRFRRASLQSVKSVRRWAKMLSTILPGDDRRILALRDRLTAELEHRAVLTGPIHADLHPSNMLVDDGQVVLIDFDNMVLGDRLLDVGRFMSALRTSALRVTGRPDGLAEAAESFLERYLRHTGEDERRARLFEAAALMVSAGTGFRLQRDGWKETAGWLVDECERTLGLATGATAGPPARPTADSMKRKDATAEAQRPVDRVGWASDPLYMRGLLAPHVERHFGAELCECEAELKGEKKKREQVRYRLAGWCGDERFRSVLDGFLWADRSGRSQNDRFILLNQALEGVGAAPRLPRPVAFLRELGLQVVEPPAGTSLAATLGEAGADRVVERLGRALGAMHGVALELNRAPREVLGVDDVRALLAPLEHSAPNAHATTGAALDRIAPLVAEAQDAAGPTVRHLSPRRVLIDGDRIAIADVDDVVLVEPCLDAAEFLVRLAALGVAGATDAARRGWAAAFRRGYLADGKRSSAVLGAFETLVRIRDAFEAGGEDNLVQRLHEATHGVFTVESRAS